MVEPVPVPLAELRLVRRRHPSVGYRIRLYPHLPRDHAVVGEEIVQVLEQPAELRGAVPSVGIAQERLPVEAEHVADEVGSITVGLNIDRGAPVQVHVWVGHASRVESVRLKRGMGSTDAREMIAEHRDVDRVTPKVITLVLMSIVSL